MAIGKRMAVASISKMSKLQSNPSARPLSPHLQVYRLPLTAMLSITHRITGVILSLGLIFVVWVLFQIVTDPVGYEAIRGFLQTWLGRVCLWLWTLSLFVHFNHGIRHLLWDIGWGFEREALNKHSIVELAVALILSIVVWLF